jgi:hypothetical protein
MFIVLNVFSNAFGTDCLIWLDPAAALITSKLFNIFNCFQSSGSYHKATSMPNLVKIGWVVREPLAVMNTGTH